MPSAWSYSHPPSQCLARPGHSGNSRAQFQIHLPPRCYNEPFLSPGLKVSVSNTLLPAPTSPLKYGEEGRGSSLQGRWGPTDPEASRQRACLQHGSRRAAGTLYLSPVAASSRAFLGVWVVTYTSLSLGSSSSSLLSTQLSACSWRSLLPFLLGRLLSEM